jgi:hypothetical protein
LPVHPEGSSSDYSSTFTYSIPPDGVYILTTDGSQGDVRSGAIQVIPDTGTATPAGEGLFSYAPHGTLVTESGVPSATPTTHAQIYIDHSNNHLVGLAIAVPGNAGVRVSLKAYQTDGSTLAGSGSLEIAAEGHVSKFVHELIPGLPAGFTGILDISAPSPFSALTLRSLTNLRGDFLLTLFPVADAYETLAKPLVFPQIVDGGGYSTQFVLLGTNGATSAGLAFYGEDGRSIVVAATTHP